MTMTPIQEMKSQMRVRSEAYGPDPRREARAFELALVSDMGRKRGKGPGSFVGDSRGQLLACYRDVLQQLRAWQPPAARLPREPTTSDEVDLVQQQDRELAGDQRDSDTETP